MELLPTTIGQKTLDQASPALEDSLRASLGTDGFLSDLVECSLASVAHPAAITPFSAFAYKLYKSEAATRAIRALLTCSLPGTSDSFDTVLSAIASGGGGSRGALGKDEGGKFGVHLELDESGKTKVKLQPQGALLHAQRRRDGEGGAADRHYCYLVGGQVRDVLRGVLSTDIDFNYSCAARDVALVTVEREWPTKYKCIGPVTVPNYVLIGDEGSDNYLEGFSISFNATKACCEMDFRQNMCLYDLANDVIIDKTGCGVNDIRSRTLRLSCAQGESYQAWASSTITQGFKELRYIKFLLRAQAKGQPLATDEAELQFVVHSLRAALRANGEALGGFWFGYALEAQLKSAAGLSALKAWVCEHGDPDWWETDWVPLVQLSASPEAISAIGSNGTGGGTGGSGCLLM